MVRARGLSAVRLARRSLRHRRAETVLIMVVSALIIGLVAFLAGYQQQAQRAIVDRALAVDGPGNSWQLTGSTGHRPVGTGAEGGPAADPAADRRIGRRSDLDGRVVRHAGERRAGLAGGRV